jgi:uncharacterized protein (TIGR02391 family)
MLKEKAINPEHLESICKVLGDQNSGSQIGQYLGQTGITDVDPTNTKWKRLYNAFAGYQNANHDSNKILSFIQKILSPVRYAGDVELFETNRTILNSRLLFIGLELLDNGKFRRVSEATTIPEAQKRADRLKEKLQNRNVHQDVITFCKAELLSDNYFHAVFEATKSVADKIREKSGLKEDGVLLIEAAFGFDRNRQPILAINTLQSDSEESEHKGFSNLLKGLFGMFRNTIAHEPKIKWIILEQDALDCLTLISMLHRILDRCERIR